MGGTKAGPTVLRGYIPKVERRTDKAKASFLPAGLQVKSGAPIYCNGMSRLGRLFRSSETNLRVTKNQRQVWHAMGCRKKGPLGVLIF